MKTAIYIRTNTSKQEKGHQAQLLALNEYLKNKGINEHTIYEDFGVSGTKQSRPGLNKLMDDCNNGKVSHVIVYSFSRFARSTKHLLEALEML